MLEVARISKENCSGMLHNNSWSKNKAIKNVNVTKYIITILIRKRPRFGRRTRIPESCIRYHT